MNPISYIIKLNFLIIRLNNLINEKSQQLNYYLKNKDFEKVEKILFRKKIIGKTFKKVLDLRKKQSLLLKILFPIYLN